MLAPPMPAFFTACGYFFVIASNQPALWTLVLVPVGSTCCEALIEAPETT